MVELDGVFSTRLRLAASILFSFYLESFANATYGTLGALIGLMVRVWISVIILIVGTELNAELELKRFAISPRCHQSGRESEARS